MLLISINLFLLLIISILLVELELEINCNSSKILQCVCTAVHTLPPPSQDPFQLWSLDYRGSSVAAVYWLKDVLGSQKLAPLVQSTDRSKPHFILLRVPQSLSLSPVRVPSLTVFLSSKHARLASPMSHSESQWDVHISSFSLSPSLTYYLLR